MSLEEVKRSTRTRKLSSRVRVFDEHTRAEITRKKLDALEKEYAAKEHAAREAAYDRNRRRLRVAGSNDAGADEDGEDDDGEEEDLRTRLSKMTDEEFKALAMERKARADKEISGGGSGGRERQVVRAD